MTPTPTRVPHGEDAAANIAKRIQYLDDRRGETLAHVRRLIHDADPDIVEEWKLGEADKSGNPRLFP